MRKIAPLAQATDAELLDLGFDLFVTKNRINALTKQLVKLNREDDVVGYLDNWDKLDELYVAWHKMRDQAQRLEGVVAAYGWSRAYLVSGGHLHKSTSCSTCFPTTQFQMMPECSGLTEDEIVTLAADRACTICYPDAPVVPTGTSQLRTRDEAVAEAARAEAEAKRAAKDAKKVTVTIPGTDREETFGTVRSALNEALSSYGWVLFSCLNSGGNTAPEHLARFDAIVAALVARRDGLWGSADELAKELIGKAETKFVREVKSHRGCTKAEALEMLEATRTVLAELTSASR